MADHIPTAGVHHVRLTVSDVDRACAFYTDKRHVTHSEIRDLGEAFGIYILIFAPRGRA